MPKLLHAGTGLALALGVPTALFAQMPHPHTMPATPATPATPAVPADPATGVGPATPATPAVPATPATPADPGQDVVQTQANPRGSDAPAVAYPDPPTANAPVPPALPADPAYRAGPYKGALAPPPPAAFNKTYPVCTRKIQDSCRNPGGV